VQNNAFGAGCKMMMVMFWVENCRVSFPRKIITKQIRANL